MLLLFPLFPHKPSTPFSLIVDDVDARSCQDDSESQDALHKLLTDSSLDYRPFSKEQSDARIKQIKVEAESRKNEFARLLEEHAQVIRRLKQIEEDGGAIGGTNA
ncbi:uncharacterized protein LOC111050041 [Nilaparvata lugens]|uniref:uncharacterized protein LOC111050041 n=1 Tax=Nilaparvata lugens TaxID=108931 RepID=UPI00193D06BF|nr:uncharacterized protein LOC111050041 [Nilaparvata lugens]